MKNKNYWTKEKCHEQSLLYDNRKDFRKLGGYIYITSFKNNWLDEICSHMIENKKKPRGYWTKEKCQEEALKFNSKNEFSNKCGSAYISCNRHNWLDDVCSHMSGRTYKPDGYWTKEKCQEEALKYSSRKEFGDKNSWVYHISLDNNWINEICSHMKIIGNLYKRCIYVYEFSDNHSYIGLTYNFDIRHQGHLDTEKGVVNQHLSKSHSTYKLKQLTKYVHVEKAKILEGKYVEKYKKLGWVILNKIKTGGIGGNLKWTKEKCHEEALKYLSKIDYKNHSLSYRISKKRGWLNDIWCHMNNDLKKTSGFWTKEKCHEEALKYITRNDFFKNSSGVYNKCVRNKWLDDVCTHMIKKKKQ